MSAAAQAPINEDKMNAFLGKVVGDFGAALSSSLAYIGIKLGLYEAMANAGPVTSKELAERTGTVERYIREWLINQAAGGYVEFDPATDRYALAAEQAVAQGILFAGNPDTVYRQIMEFQRKAGAFGHLNIIGRSGFLTHKEAVKGIKMFARDVLPRIEESKVEVHDVVE